MPISAPCVPHRPSKSRPRHSPFGFWQSLKAGAIALALAGALATPVLAADAGTYQVKSGDTVSSIARQYQTTASNIAALNNLTNPNVLAVGQVLTIPVAPPNPAPPAATDATGASANAPATSADVTAASTDATVASAGAHCPGFAISDDGVVERTLVPCPVVTLLPGVAAVVPPAVAPTTAVAPTMAVAPTTSSPATAILAAPYYSQFDGSSYAETNCGPTALSMALGALHINVPQLTLRQVVNVNLGTSNPNSGTTWASLAYAAQQEGAQVLGPYQSQGSSRRSWTVADLTSQLAQGHPVLLLVHYRDLPGNQGTQFNEDHYIVALGVDQNGNIVYNDPAFRSSAGAHRTITPAQLNVAWTNTSEGLVRTALAMWL